MHYYRWKRTGVVETTTRNVSGIVGDDEARFWYFVNKADDDQCWLWKGTLSDTGYGVIGIAGRMRLAHRYSYELNVGPIPDGYEVDHVYKRGCRHTACVNPAHLEAVTSQENLRRITDRYDFCPRGHLVEGDNRYDRPDGRGRDCLKCRRERAAEHQRAKRAANLALGLTTKGTPRKR